MTTEVDAVVEAVTMQPGGALVLRFSYRMSDDEIDRVKKQFDGFKDRTGAEVCVVDGCDQILVVRGGEGEGE